MKNYGDKIDTDIVCNSCFVTLLRESACLFIHHKLHLQNNLIIQETHESMNSDARFLYKTHNVNIFCNVVFNIVCHVSQCYMFY